MSRKRYVYTRGGEPIKDADGNLAPIEVSDDYTGAEIKAKYATEGILYGNIQATDGTDLSTRKKHREYMKANGLALSSDYSNHWAKAEQQRGHELSANFDSRGRREDIARVLETRGRKR